jgi:translation initiation factor 2 alpha subunit (eIF-2alpha)|tara:strand:+ start:1023 stop:1724 length:702 start_codon:yes stop_codon:yes gene_type:complete
MEEGDLLLCTVEKVSNTITIVRLPNGKEGTIVSSEIAPGRIKHMRQYVVPNKRIVCKILEISGNNIHLSLRRVNSKEKKEVMQRYKQDQAINIAFKEILGENSNETKKILEDFESLREFIDKARTDKELILKYIPKDNQEAIRKITEKKMKNSELKQYIRIKCLEEDGIKRIKEIFNLKNSNANVSYISAGNFRLSLTVEDFKEGKKEMAKIIEDLEKRSKKNNCEFSSEEER